MDNLLAIDIHDDCVSGVLLEYGPKITVVRGYAVASAKDSSFAEAIASIIHQTGYEQGDCRVAVSAEKFFFRNLVLPFADTRKIEKILPFELEELTSFALDTLHLDFLASASKDDTTSIVAAMVDKDYFLETLAQLAAHGLDPEIFAVSGLQTAAALLAMGPERDSFVVLDISFNETTLILVDGGRIALVRSLAVNAEKLAGFTISPTDAKVLVAKPEQMSEIVRQVNLPLQQTLISVGRSHLVSKDIPCFINGGVGLYPAVFEQLKKALPLDVLPCNIAKQPLLKVEPSDELPWNPSIMNKALALALWKKKDCPIFNFRKGMYKKQPSLKILRKNLMAAAIPLCLICIGVIGFLWWEYSELAKRRDMLNNEIISIFHEALPEATKVVNPVQQLRVKIDEVRDINRTGSDGGASITKVALISELSSRIPQNLPIHISRLVADQNDLRIKAETSDFNTVDNVKRELEKSDLFKSVEISSANMAPKGGEVRFELKLEFR